MQNDMVYLKTTHGLQQVDVIYRRVDDAFLDPLCFRPDSALGVAGVINAWRAGNVAIVNAPGNGIADDKAIYPFVPDIIRYYLGEWPILENVPTYQMTDHDDRAYVLDNLEKMVVKAVAESGGYGMLMGPVPRRPCVPSSPRRSRTTRATTSPSRWCSSPATSATSTASWSRATSTCAPYVIYGEDIEVVPGGLTRVALTKGSLVVNSSQGGGSKDTWVLAD